MSVKCIPLLPHFYIVKLGFIEVFFFTLIQNIECGYSLKPPWAFFLFLFFRFNEHYFPEFLHLIDLFNDYLCFYTYLKQFNFLWTFRSADIPAPYRRHHY